MKALRAQQENARGDGQPSALRRTVRNSGWLLGGKGIGGLLSLLYLALATRSLGPAGFGVFALIIAYGQAVTNLVQFQSWQMVIRYGAGHLAAQQPERLGRLLTFTAMLDLGSGLLSVLVAFFGAGIAARFLGWNAEEQRMAGLFAFSLVFAVRATPVGILRLFGRFDLSASAETVMPVVRLIGAVAAFLLLPTVGAFLATWATAEALTFAAMWTAALREARRNFVLQPSSPWLAGLKTENPDLWRFTLLTNCASSINLLWQQVAVLGIGWAAGPTAVGGYRVASQIAQALGRPALMLTRSIYPEFARFAGSGDFISLKESLWRATRFSALAGVCVAVFLVGLGGPLLSLLAGASFSKAYPFLAVLSVATALDLAGFALEPALVALGRPGMALAVRGSAGLIYGIAVLTLVHAFGGIGAAVAAVAGSALLQAFMALGCIRALRSMPRVIL